MPRPRTYPGAVGTDLRLADLPQLLVGARDQVFARRRQRDAQRAHAAYAAAVARRERARRRPQRQLWTRVGAAGGLAAAAVTVPLGIDPALWAGAGAALWSAVTLKRLPVDPSAVPDAPVLPPPLLPIGCPADPLVHRAYSSATALRGLSVSAPPAAREPLALAARESESALPELYALGQRVGHVAAVRARTADPTARRSLDAAIGALMQRLSGAVAAQERLCSSGATALAAEAEHWSFESDRLEAATRDLASVADSLRETAAAEERAGLR
jgi:hypothetical protein